uniref:ATP-dependent RNA helicase CshA (EC) n=1 Tax=Ganoderma boninense TaxID=34458 RepID=A0A5K1K2Z4_9APHY|nr:ATP-dependent RNA helicase CshA (EC [Ganoderma boninense]
MQFLTLFAATVATFVASTVAAPGNYGNGGDNGAQNVRVGFSLDLNPTTPIGSLSCAATFAKKFPQFHTLGDLPTAPFYGEVPGAVDGSSECASCWKLQYDGQAPVYMIAVDNAEIFQLSKTAFEQFAGAQGIAKGIVNATAAQVSPDFCHL